MTVERFVAGMTVERFIAGMTNPFNERRPAPMCCAPRRRG